MTFGKIVSYFIMFIVAVFLLKAVIFWKFIAIPLLILTLVKDFYKGWNQGIIKIADIAFSMAQVIDMFGNIILQVPFNLLFVKEGGYLYGVTGETISSATGKNALAGTLTKSGIVFNNILSFCFGRNHSISSIQSHI